jgi:hypothetical protein
MYMADKINSISVSKESLPVERGKEGQREKGEKAERNIQEKSKEFIEGVSEVVEGVENAEGVETTGEVAEGLGEGKKKAAAVGGISSSSGKPVNHQPIAPPSIEIMRIQVSTQIKNEIRMLEKEAARLMRGSGGFHPFQLNKVVSKIRELKDILSGLAYATAETLKGWWMKFVKGITT